MLNWNHASPETIRIYFVHALGDVVAGNQPIQSEASMAAAWWLLIMNWTRTSWPWSKILLRNFRDSNDDVRLESAVDVLGCMHENGLNDFLPHFAKKAVKVLSIIPATLIHAHPRDLSAPSGA